FWDRLEDDAGYANLMERESGGQATDAATGDDHKVIRHHLSPICAICKLAKRLLLACCSWTEPPARPPPPVVEIALQRRCRSRRAADTGTGANPSWTESVGRRDGRPIA